MNKVIQVRAQKKQRCTSHKIFNYIAFRSLLFNHWVKIGTFKLVVTADFWESSMQKPLSNKAFYFNVVEIKLSKETIENDQLRKEK